MPVWWSPKGPFKNKVYKIKICSVCELQLAANSQQLCTKLAYGLIAFHKRNAWNRSNLKLK